jgi:hypothetical protein
MATAKRRTDFGDAIVVIERFPLNKPYSESVPPVARLMSIVWMRAVLGGS